MTIKRYLALLLSLILLCAALPALAEEENTIIGATEIQRYYSNKKQAITLNYRTSDHADISYELDDEKNKLYISKDGQLIIPAYYVGYAELIVTAEETDDYCETSLTVEIRVFPRATEVTLSAKSISSIKVSWKKISEAAAYKIFYSTSSKMTNAKVVTVSKSKTSYTLTGLTPGKRYYVRVRTLGDDWGYTYTNSPSKNVKLGSVVPVESFKLCKSDDDTSLSGKTISLKVGARYKVKATSFSPSDATTKKVYWKSSNPDVASVNANGLVCALLRGTATITATAQDGWGAKVKFKVKVK